MATTADYMEYVRECLEPFGEVKTRKMFGEYAAYMAGKLVLLVCDDCVFVKKLPELADIMKNAPCGYPYEGEKEHYVLDVEDKALLTELMPKLIEFSPVPKKLRSKPRRADS